MSVSPSSQSGTFGAAASTHRLSTRVCDNCIRSKVRCEIIRQFPVTSTDAAGRGKICSYSTTRRRPGPAPGSGRVPRATREAGNRERRYPGKRRLLTVQASRYLITRFGDIEEATLQADSILEDTTSSVPGVSDLPSESPDTLVTSHASTGNQSTQSLNILPEEESYLADEYFKSINEAIPLFSEATASNSKDILLTCNPELAEALLLITAKLLGFKFASPRFDLDGRIDLILSNTTLQEDTAGDFPSLDLFRKFCLLVFYEFHQFPGQQAWVRIGKIVRLAYWMGLDRLDIIQSVSPEWSNVSDADLQNWKLVWWCVYRLDSYANLSSGTPYQVDERLVNTSLNHQSQLSQGLVAPCRLPHDPRGLPDLLFLTTELLEPWKERVHE
ncbi:hypothetical protein FANTH_1974 [Fusarium anthophilum]|uniref:Xylanolytic transcriptional activator regulatory domain-containing protein n=1 Tax=Fusarium anthophilum TaxID=48485 RepID=A0A8H5EAK5_9HYPO|nr:hypothetical protein FANTH_1974 [Fusarium anthophilum]